MKIHEDIYIVGSGESGFSLSNPFDCTVFLLDGGSECALIDAGCGIEPSRILENILALGIDRHKIHKILLTHAHADHSGGAYALAKTFDATVYALPESAQYVRTGDLQAISLAQAIQGGIYPADYQYHPCPTVALCEAEPLCVGRYTLRVLRTEGHSAGHASYLFSMGMKNILFSGDSIFCDGTFSLQATWDCDLQQYLKTCELLARQNVDVLLPSHGRFALQEGQKHLAKALGSIQQLKLPL